ncbi:MAG: hypothetical protein K8R21_10850 [Leptospira sp.]|nr:hypothetical protein [Leptospira sp.]
MAFNDSGFLKEPYKLSTWIPSQNFETNNNNYLQTVTVPFTLPAEAQLSPEYNRLNAIPVVRTDSAKTPFIGMSLPGSQISLMQKDSGNSSFRIVSYDNKFVAPSNYASRDQYSRLPSLWQSNASPLINTNSGMMFMYLKKNMGLNFDLSIRLMGSPSGNATAESVASGMTFSYRLANNIFKQFEQTGVNFVFGLSGLQRLDDRIYPKADQIKGRTVSINPGFTFTTRSMMFEGVVQLPLHQNANIGEVDTMWKYEYQGRLGMKWYLPEFIKP